MCHHILLFTVPHYLYCVHFLRCYFIDKYWDMMYKDSVKEDHYVSF